MKRYQTLLGPVCAVLVVALGCAPSDPPVGEFGPQELPDIPDAAAEADAVVDNRPLTPDGTWLQVLHISNCLFLGQMGLGALTRTVMVVQLEAGESGLLLQRVRTCQFQQSPVLGMATDLTNKLAETIPERTMVGLLYGRTAGAPYETGLDVELWGVKMEDPFNEPVPTSADDPRVYDQDEDGLPGVTLYIGQQRCTMAVVQRAISRWKGAVQSPTMIAGTGTSVSDEAILETSGGLCSSRPKKTPIEGDSQFLLMRADGRDGSENLDTDGDGQVSCEEAREYVAGHYGPLVPDDSKCVAGEDAGGP